MPTDKYAPSVHPQNHHFIGIGEDANYHSEQGSCTLSKGKMVMGEKPAKVQIKKSPIKKKMVDYFPEHWSWVQLLGIFTYIGPTTGRSSHTSSCLSSNNKKTRCRYYKWAKTSTQESIWCIKWTHLNLDEPPVSVIVCLSNLRWISLSINQIETKPPCSAKIVHRHTDGYFPRT